MKILKKLRNAVLVLAVLLVLVVAAAFAIDALQTRYLKTNAIAKNQPDRYILTNVHVVPMTADTVLKNTTISVANGYIESVGQAVDTANLPVIDGGGAYIMPGLIDMHVHVWDAYELGLYLANGVTAVRNLWGQPMHLRMKKKSEQNLLVGPMFFTSSPKLTGPEYLGDDNIQLYSTAEASAKVTAYKRRGYDFIKTYNGLPDSLFNAIVAQSAHEDLAIAAHPSALVPYAHHFNLHIKTIEHAEDIVQQPLAFKLDTAKLNEVVDLFALHPNTALCPTLVVYFNISRLISDKNVLQTDAIALMNPLIKYVDSKAQFERWQAARVDDPEILTRILAQHEFHLYSIKRLHDAGALLVCGTDAGIGITPAGVSIHQELAFYAEAGLSNYEVLKTATVNPRNTHDFFANMGTVTAGAYANLLVTRENPLEKLATLQEPEMVICKGRMITRTQLDGFKEKAQNRNNLLVSLLRYLEFLLIER